jgi:hypothetical protein
MRLFFDAKRTDVMRVIYPQDYSACKWPEGFPGADEPGAEASARWFDQANESDIQRPGWSLLQQVMAANSSCGSCSNNIGSSSSSSSGNQRNNNMQQTGWATLQHVMAGADTSGSTVRSAAGSTGGSSGSDAAGGCSSWQLDMISFSHFLPHQELLPEKRMLTYPNLVSPPPHPTAPLTVLP